MIGLIGKELSKYKKWILIYVSICILLSVLMSPFFGISEVKASATLSSEQTVYQITKLVTGDFVKNMAGSFAPVIGVSADPFLGLLVIGVLDLLNQKVFHGFLPIIPTPVGHPIVIGIVALFVVISKLMKCNEGTKLIGELTLGELEKYLGFAFMFILGIFNTVGLVNIAVTSVSNASRGGGASNTPIFIGIIAAILSTTAAFISLIGYVVAKTVFFAIDSLLALVPIPLSGLVVEIIKTIVVILSIVIGVLAPWIALVVNFIILIVCIFLLRFALTVAEFMRVIYIKPFIKRMSGFSDSYPLVYRKIPKKLKKILQDEKFDYKLVIPAYSYKSKETEEFKIKYMNKFWIVSDGVKTIAFTKKKRSSKWNRYELTGVDAKKLYVKEHFRFLEMFTATVTNKDKFKKDTRFIFTKEYCLRLNDIIDISNAENFNVLSGQLKMTKKEMRKDRRNEFINNTKSWFADAFNYRQAVVEEIKADEEMNNGENNTL